MEGVLLADSVEGLEGFLEALLEDAFGGARRKGAYADKAGLREVDA